MKKIIIGILMAMFIIPQYSNGQSDSLKVGFILANLYTTRWKSDKFFFENKMKELGAKVIIKDCYDQLNNQIVAAKELIEDDVDAIVIVAVDAIESGVIADLGKAANIPVIAYDRLILNTSIDYYVSFNGHMIGELMANNIIDNLPSGRIIYLGGPPDDYNSVLIRQGVFDALSAHKDKYSIIASHVGAWNELDAYLKVQDIMNNSDTLPSAIICASDNLTKGALEVLRENDLVGKVMLTGQDAELEICRYIAQDIVNISIYKPVKQLAERTAEEVYKIISSNDASNFIDTVNNGSVDVPSILLNPIPVTKESIPKTVIKDGVYTSKQIYGK